MFVGYWFGACVWCAFNLLLWAESAEGKSLCSVTPVTVVVWQARVRETTQEQGVAVTFRSPKMYNYFYNICRHIEHAWRS